MQALILAAAAALAPGGSAAPDDVGRIYSYVRSNRDGSEAERVHVYRARADFVEVAKMRARCTNAAFVTAELDLERGHAKRMTGGRLLPGAAHRDFAALAYDPGARTLEARVETRGGAMTLSTEVADEPWHLYDFDLASLTVLDRADPRADFSFGVPLIWLGGDPADALRYLGRADARFVREEEHAGRPALRFEVGGPAFGDEGGPIWFDAAEGHVLGAEFGRPNHAEYRDFALRLTGTSHGAEAWRRLLEEHFEGCE